MIHPLTRNGRAKHLSSRRPPCLSPHAERSKKGGRARRDRVAAGLYPKSAPEPGHRFNIARWRGSMRRASLVPGQFNDRPHAGKPGGQSQQQAGENVSDPFDVSRLSPLACPVDVSGLSGPPAGRRRWRTISPRRAGGASAQGSAGQHRHVGFARKASGRKVCSREAESFGGLFRCNHSSPVFTVLRSNRQTA